MKISGEHTYREITTQVEAWAAALAEFGRNEKTITAACHLLQPKQIITTGCGSTHYLAQTAAHLLQNLTQIPTTALPASAIALSPDQALIDPENTLLLTISRSGTTSETLHAVEQFRRRHGKAVWTIGCYPDSTLAQQADLALIEPLGQEQSVAQTRSFATMLVLVQALTALLGNQEWQQTMQLPVIAEQLLHDSAELMQTLGSNHKFKRLYFLGSGAQYGIANEAMLKMTEMSLTHAQAFHFMEFRHGPMSMANEDALVVGLVSADRTQHDQQVLSEMRKLGAAVLAITPHSNPIDCDWQIMLPDNVPDWAMPVLYLPALQLLAYNRSLSKKLDPDNPRNLEAVVYLDAASFT